MSAPKKSRVRVRLVVTGFPGTLDELTSRLGAPPDRALMAGEPVSPGKVRVADRWVIDASTGDELSLQEQLNVLLGRVSPLTSQLSKLPPPTAVRISCGIMDYSRDVALYFDPEVISALAQMKASLDVDYYDMSAPEQD